MKWKIIVLWESCNHLGNHYREYEVDSLVSALRERHYIIQHEPLANVIIKRVKQ